MHLLHCNFHLCELHVLPSLPACDYVTTFWQLQQGKQIEKYLYIFSCLECNDCAVTFAPRFVSHTHLFCSSAASFTFFFATWFNHPPLPFSELGARMRGCNLTYEFLTDCYQMLHRTQCKNHSSFISHNPSDFRACWLQLTVFSRALIYLKINVLAL